jgi:hypothetical protein
MRELLLYGLVGAVLVFVPVWLFGAFGVIWGALAAAAFVVGWRRR